MPKSLNTRRAYLGLVAAGAVTVAGCQGSDDGENGGSGDGGGGGDPATACDSPESGDREALVPQDESPVEGLTQSGSPMTPEFSGSISRQESRDADLEEFNYGSAGRAYDAAEEDEFSLSAVEFDRDPPELDTDEIFRFVETPFGPEYEVAIYVVIDEWVFVVGGSSEETSRELFGAFPELSTSCAEAATLLRRDD